MSEAWDTYEHAGLTVELHYDSDPSNPREDMSNVGTMVCSHQRANLGDEQLGDIDFELDCDVCDGTGEHPELYEVVSTALGGYMPMIVHGGLYEPAADRYADALSAQREPQGRLHRAQPAPCPNPKCDGGVIAVTPLDYFKRKRGARVVLPLYLYEHSGMTMRTGPFGDPWDSGQVGVIFDTPDGVSECLGADATDEEITAALESEVKLYDQFLTGDVHGYVIKGPNSEDISDLLGPEAWDDSLWGVFDEFPYEYLKSEANSSAESLAKRLEHERQEAAYCAAMDIVTEGVR